MLKNSPKKIADKLEVEVEIVREEKDKQGVIVGPAFDFLFEGEDKKYDEKYADFI
jgi:hypothetical protein